MVPVPFPTCSGSLTTSLTFLHNLINTETTRRKKQNSARCRRDSTIINALMSTSSYQYNATSNNMQLVHWPLMGELLRLVQRGGHWAGLQPAQAPVPNVTAHPSTASVPMTVLLYNGPLLCGFNVPIKGLMN